MSSSAHATRKQYFGIFVALFVLTVLEVAVVKMPGIPKDQLILVLVVMALVKATLVALFFMHLKWETRILRWMVGVPLATPAMYAVVLIADAMWRRL